MKYLPENLPQPLPVYCGALNMCRIHFKCDGCCSIRKNKIKINENRSAAIWQNALIDRSGIQILCWPQKEGVSRRTIKSIRFLCFVQYCYQLMFEKEKYYKQMLYYPNALINKLAATKTGRLSWLFEVYMYAQMIKSWKYRDLSTQNEAEGDTLNGWLL